ncbi:MAG: hypothetical protein JWO38_5621, partial [Gemmataceae bacterium]|nr:hypothetical protein [Gemmataceae bacterium]
MLHSRLARWAVTTGLLAGTDSAAFGQNPGSTPPQPVGPVVTVNWKRAGTTDPAPPPPPLAPPTVVVVAGDQPATPPQAPGTILGLPLVRLSRGDAPARVLPPGVRPGTVVLPRLPHRYQDPTHPVGPEQHPVDTAAPVVRVSGVSPDNKPAPTPTWVPSQLPGAFPPGVPGMTVQSTTPNPPAAALDGAAPV